jgi:hypothetical protein
MRTITRMARTAGASVAAATRAPAPQDGMGRHLMAAVLLAACAWFMIQAATYGLREVLPAQTSLKLAPRSPDALARAAEAFEAEGRTAEAATLARQSIALAPFDARAVRVLGLATTQDEDLADRLVTLAANWSLRDDRAHAWLMMRRAQQGQTAAALAHADLLLRRRTELYDSIFPIFDVFAADPGGPRLVAQRLAFKPNWRPTYFFHLAKLQLSTGVEVARALKATSAPPTPDELAGLYGALILQKRYADLIALHGAMAGNSAPPIRDGGFPLQREPAPLGWWFAQTPGFDGQVIADSGRSENGMFVLRHDAFTPGVAARQVLILPAGQWHLSGRVRWATPMPTQPPTWTLTCLSGGATQPLAQVVPTGDVGSWAGFSASFIVPSDCLAQHIELIAPSGQRRQDVEATFDDFSIQAQ